MVTSVLYLAATARAQSVSFEDDFECNDDSSFAGTAGQWGWKAIRSSDTFNTSFNDGVSPNSDDNTARSAARSTRTRTSS
jgi:hypothetical protein